MIDHQDLSIYQNYTKVDKKNLTYHPISNEAEAKAAKALRKVHLNKLYPILFVIGLLVITLIFFLIKGDADNMQIILPIAFIICLIPVMIFPLMRILGKCQVACCTVVHRETRQIKIDAHRSYTAYYLTVVQDGEMDGSATGGAAGELTEATGGVAGDVARGAAEDVTGDAVEEAVGEVVGEAVGEAVGTPGRSQALECKIAKDIPVTASVYNRISIGDRVYVAKSGGATLGSLVKDCE